MEDINLLSTKLVYIEIFFNNQKLSTATGFQVHQGHKYLVTNWHVVSGKNFITKECVDSRAAIPNKLVIKYKKHLSNSESTWVEESVELYDENENPRWHEHPIHNSDVDVAIIPIETYPEFQSDLESFKIESNSLLKVTDTIYVLGFPYGIIINTPEEPYAVWTRGSVASEPSLELNIEEMEKQLPAFLIDSRTRNGQSGSPVIYYSQMGIDHISHPNNIIMGNEPVMKEIGIYSGRINKESDLGYVWRWSLIEEILEGIK